MADVFDIKILGDKDLQRKLNRLPEVIQREIIPPIFTRSLNRLNAFVALAWSGGVVQERTGVTADAFAAVSAREYKGRTAQGVIVVALKLPERSKLGIDPKDEAYYPAAVEYGVSHGPRQFPAKAPIRKTVSKHQEREFAIMAREIGAAIESRAGRL